VGGACSVSLLSARPAPYTRWERTASSGASRTATAATTTATTTTAADVSTTWRHHRRQATHPPRPIHHVPDATHPPLRGAATITARPTHHARALRIEVGASGWRCSRGRGRARCHCPGTVDHPHAGNIAGLIVFKWIGGESATVLVGDVFAASPAATNSQTVSGLPAGLLIAGGPGTSTASHSPRRASAGPSLGNSCR
jgi:hypothetical protein